MEIFAWSVAIVLIVVGLVGSVVPLLPGTTLILAGALLQKWLLPDTLTWLVVGWIAAFWLLSVMADIGCTIVGTRLFGGSKWGVAGATGGAVAGMFLSIPALLLGTILGAVLAEKWLAKRTGEQALVPVQRLVSYSRSSPVSAARWSWSRCMSFRCRAWPDVNRPLLVPDGGFPGNAEPQLGRALLNCPDLT